MKTLGNIIWFIFGGFIGALCNFLVGCLLCVTIVLIPFGRQYFKLAGLMLWPFGKQVDADATVHPVANIFWNELGGFVAAVLHFVIGILLCVTIILIPFAKQHFKLAKLSLIPFGAVVSKV